MVSGERGRVGESIDAGGVRGGHLCDSSASERERSERLCREWRKYSGLRDQSRDTFSRSRSPRELKSKNIYIYIYV